ncbi:hypothetical protein J3454_15970 [Erythrobacter sp. NFXS35]|uniref:hypothetical protein n=1 Tax=Erythrobacter sp. NFXS35 TaxID=2818436 RepID=UPI0032DE2F7A
MTDLNDLWVDLFGVEITVTELKVLEGVERRVGSNDTILILCSILIRFIVLVLFRDPKSPFVRAKHLGDKAAKLETTLNELHETVAWQIKHAQSLYPEVKRLRIAVQKTEKVLSDARKDAREREEFPRRAYHKMAWVCFISSSFGTLATVVLVMLVTGS